MYGEHRNENKYTDWKNITRHRFSKVMECAITTTQDLKTYSNVFNSEKLLWDAILRSIIHNII